MKLTGLANSKYFIASIDRHDYINRYGLMVDGGQPGTANYAGYTKASGELIWAEVPQTFAELFTDYQIQSKSYKRKFGIWKLEEVTILPPSEYPDTTSWDWKLQTTIWGTYGKDKKEKLRYILLNDADTEHLEAIYPLTELLQPTITYILESRKKSSLQQEATEQPVRVKNIKIA